MTRQTLVKSATYSIPILVGITVSGISAYVFSSIAHIAGIWAFFLLLIALAFSIVLLTQLKNEPENEDSVDMTYSYGLALLLSGSLFHFNITSFHAIHFISVYLITMGIVMMINGVMGLYFIHYENKKYCHNN